MKGTRVLRYLGNREVPERELYSPLEYLLHDFPLLVAMSAGDLVAASKHIPNPMFSDFQETASGLFVPTNALAPVLPFVYMNAPIPSFWPATAKNQPDVERKPEVDFEVNLMEPLIGWKSWYVDSGILKSNSGFCLWHGDVRTEAQCVAGCAKVPAEQHTCGIYGASVRSTAEEYGDVLGMVYGWGRYIRGTAGWRAQFAYPRCFYLREEQMNLVDLLMQYHVPIYVSQPIQMYDPSEEGYDGYWNQKEDGSFGTATLAASGEAGSASDIPF